MAKGASELVSFVFVTLIVFVGIGVVLGIGLPLLDEARETGIIGEAGQNMEIVDNLIRQVASGGAGTLRVAQINVNDGTYRIDSDTNSFSFELPLKTGALPKGTFSQDGNLITTITGAASASQNSTHLKLENELIEVVFLRVGSESGFASINTSTLLKTMRSKTDPQTTIVPTNFGVTLNGTSGTSWGTGYTKLAFEGDDLTSSSVLAHIRSSQGAEYEVLYTLRASSDFLSVDVRNTTRNQTTLTYGYRIGQNSVGDVIRIAGNETSFTLSGGGLPGGSTNATAIIDNTNYTRNSSSIVLSVGNATQVLYNASDGSLRDVRELLGIGQGSWNYTSNSTHITVNYTLAGSDGYEFGVRDFRPGGSYWLDENGSLYGMMNVSNDFITVGMTENDFTVYNSSRKMIFNTFFTGNVASGGTITYSGGREIHTFTSNGTLNVTRGGIVEYLVVAGGGSGGDCFTDGYSGGGGGAGGFLEGTTTVSAQAYTITVGSGGGSVGGGSGVGADGNDGTNSTFSSINAKYGGGGDGSNVPPYVGHDGGSGGGGAGCNGFAAGGSGVTGQGHNGGGGNGASPYQSGGGGGAYDAGVSYGRGGLGNSSSISGTSLTYATGGENSGGTSGTTNRGDGGDGNDGVSGAGGSGIVIVSFPMVNAVSVDGNSLISTYGTGVQNKTVYFFDWSNQTWKVWMKNASNSTHGVPEWLDPRNKQAFKWRYAFVGNQIGAINVTNVTASQPPINVTFLITSHDPFVRTFVDFAPGIRNTNFNDDFTSYASQGSADSSWVSNDVTHSRVDVTNDVIGVDLTNDGTIDNIVHDLGAGKISDTRWVMRFRAHVPSGAFPTFSYNWLTMSTVDQTQSSNSGSYDYLGMFFRIGTQSGCPGICNEMWAVSGDGTAENGASVNGNVLGGFWSANRDYFFEFVRNGNYFTIRQYNDSTYKYFINESTTQTSSGVNALRYIRYGNYLGVGGGPVTGFYFDDFQFWNNVSDVGQSNVTFTFGLPENRTSVTAAENGLVGYWNFNEGQGVNVSDSSGNGFVGGLNNGPTWVSDSRCIFGNCLNFDGTDDFVDIKPEQVNPAIRDFTWSAWFYPTASSQNGNIISNVDGVNTLCPVVELISGALRVGHGCAGGTDFDSISVPAVNKWSHVVMVSRNGHPYIVYHNGTRYSGGASNSDRKIDVTIGRRDTGTLPFTGLIDDVKIYRRALNDSEIQQLYQTGINQQKPGIYFTKNNATDNEEVLFATTNFKNVNHTGFNIFSNHTNFFGFNYTFNSTQNQNFLFTLGTMGRMNTTVFNPANNATQFSGETMESVANSTLTWYDIGGIMATGGAVTYSGGYKIHTFTSNGTFNVTFGSGEVEYLVVAGGGGGSRAGGGGGAGGMLTGFKSISSGNYNITIGSSGAGSNADATNGVNGGNSIFSTVTSSGGGGGTSRNGAEGGDADGGSGGGGDGWTAGINGLGIAGQGNDGGDGGNGATAEYCGGGGGGSGSAGESTSGTTGGDGGNGTSSSISGVLVTYAGGGGGACVTNNGAAGTGGSGGGGAGSSSGNGVAGTDGLGGGGGSGYNAFTGGAGGSGIVIIRYLASWNSTSSVSGIAQHNVPLSFNYDGGAAGIWRFDEGSGLNATDSSGNGNVGTLVSGPTWVTNSSCKVAGCIYFDGSNNYVDLGKPASLSMTGAMSFEAWLYPTGSGSHIGGNFDSIGQTAQWNLLWANGGSATTTLRWQQCSSNTCIQFSGTTAYATWNKWNHVAVVRDSATGLIKLYVNGVQDGTTATSTSATIGAYSSSGTNALGAAGTYSGMKFSGYMDEPRLYSRALSESEILSHYQREVSKYYDDFGTAASGKTYRYFGVEDSNTTLQPITPKDAVLHYRFNDNSTANATDSSGLGSSGGVINGVSWVVNSSCKSGFGGCMSFDGTNDYIAVRSGVFPSGSGPRTFSLWFNPRTLSGEQMFFLSGVNVADQRFIMRMSESGFPEGSISVDDSGSYVRTSASVVTANRWNHLLVTHAGGDVQNSNTKIYVNGSLVAADETVSGTTNTASGVGYIGSFTGTQQFVNGLMDEFMVVNRSLSPDEVYQLYLGGFNRTVGGKWHRAASADGLQSMSFNLTDHNNTFEGTDYDMRAIFVNGTSEGTVSTSTSPTPACYTRQNTSYLYACSYDQSELSSARSSGIVYSGDADSFISLCQDVAASEYAFNVTSLGALKSVIPFPASSCSVVANQSDVITRLGLPTRPFGSYSISGDGRLHMSLHYDRISLNGTGRFGQGSHRICIENAGRQGAAALVNVGEC